MTVSFATEVVTEFLNLLDSFTVEIGTFIPADALSNKPQQIYDALITLAQHDGNWDRWQKVATSLSRIATNGYDAMSASWALAADKIDDLTDNEKDARFRLQATAADLSVAIRNDFESLQRSRPRTSKPKFAVQSFDNDPQTSHVESVVNDFGQVIADRSGLEIPITRLPSSMEDITYCLAYWYTRGSKRTNDDYQHYAVGAMFLAHVCWPSEYEIVKSTHMRSADFMRMTAEQRQAELDKSRVACNAADRAVFAGFYWKQVFLSMCRRFAYWYQIELPDHTTTSQ